MHLHCPGGKIVLLDDLVTLAENEQQLDSIILHELGHVHHRPYDQKVGPFELAFSWGCRLNR